MTLSLDLFRQTSVRDLVFDTPAAVLGRHVPLAELEDGAIAIRHLLAKSDGEPNAMTVMGHLEDADFENRRQVMSQVSRLDMGIIDGIIGPYSDCTDLCLLSFNVRKTLYRGPTDANHAKELVALWENGTKDSQVAAKPSAWCVDLIALYQNSSLYPDYRSFLAAMARVLFVNAHYKTEAVLAAFDGLAQSIADKTEEGGEAMDSSLAARDGWREDPILRHLFNSRIVLPHNLTRRPVKPAPRPEQEPNKKRPGARKISKKRSSDRAIRKKVSPVKGRAR